MASMFSSIFGRWWKDEANENDLDERELIAFPQKLIDKYHILRSIGKGAFGTVYEVSEIRSNGKFALKHVTTKPHTEKEQIKELELQTNCHSDYVVKVYDHVLQDGHMFIIMELCEGGNLRDWITRHRKHNMIKEVVVLNMLVEVCKAVHSCHNSHVIHRDLKPENILLDSSRSVKLADFGVAKQLDLQSNRKLNTFCGTFPYMAPELYQTILNESDADGYDQSCDVWSLGCVLFDMSTHTNKFIWEIPETGKGLGLEVCHHGNEIVGTLIAEHIPLDCVVTRKLLFSMLTVSPRERIPLIDVLLDRDLQRSVENSVDGHWYD